MQSNKPISFAQRALFALLVSSSFGASTVVAVEKSAQQKAKEAAAGYATRASQLQFNLANPSAAAQPNSRMTEDAYRGSLSEFQRMSGVSGTTQVSNHATNEKAGSVMNINVDTFIDYQCGTGEKRMAAAGIHLRILGCESDPGVPESKGGNGLVLEVCGKTLESSLCTPEDYDRLAPLTRGSYTDWSSLKIGLACNSTDLCRISFKGHYQVGGSDETLRQKSEGLGAQKGSISADLAKAITEGDYAGKVLEYGVPLKECSDDNQGSLDKGVISNCGGRGDSISIKGDQPGQLCKPERRCVRTEKKPIQTEKSCVRSFDLTERVTKLQYGQYASCTVKEVVDPKTEKRTVEDSCVVDGKDMRAGKNRITATHPVCSKTGKLLDEAGKEKGDDVCLDFQRTEYWVSLADVKVLSQIDQPSAVIGACAPATGSMDSVCANNNWFGRILPADQCTASVVDETGEVVTVQLDNNSLPGCGMCLTPVVSQACYGAPAVGEVADTCSEYSSRNTCVMVDVRPYTTTEDAGGLVTSQEEVYQCSEGAEVCVEWETVEDACYNSDMAQGLDKLTFSNDGYAAFASALVAAGTLDSVGAGVDSSQGANAAAPKIFNGDASSCHRPTGGVGNLLNQNCCSKDMERPKKGQLIRKGCDTDDVELAAARRSSYAKYIGEYCSKKSFWGKCLRRTESYCVFPGILPRLVHEQGRQQLLEMASGKASSNMTSATMGFNYYDAGRGSWSAETVVNGNKVRAWQWPSYCKNPEEMGKAILENPNSPSCPGMVTTWFATCTTGQCDELIDSPEHGALTWELMNVNPLEAQSNALNRFTIAKGGCTENNSCNYEIKAWPLGVGGKAVVSRTLTWQLYSEQQEISSQNVDSASTYKMSNVGDFMFKGFSQPGGGGALPGTVRMDFSNDGGQTWTSYQLPTNLPNQEMTLGTSGATVIGSCDVITNMCGFSMTGTTSITAKPWGSARSPDCSGFTGGQLAAVDFGQMDLSEWLATVVDRATGDINKEELVAEATAQFSAYNSIYSGGEVSQTQSANRAANFARIVPSEGFGPFDVRIAISGIWPEITGNSAVDTDVVNRVTVNWGDCSPEQELVKLLPHEGNGFRATHRYEAPDAHACLGNPETNITHRVILKAYTSKSGVQERTLSVENAWSKFPGGKHNNDFESKVLSADPGQGAPASPVQDIFKSKP